MHASDCLFALYYHSDRESLRRSEEIARLLAKQHDTVCLTHTHTPMMIIAPFLCRLLPLSTEGQSENNRKTKEKRHRDKKIQLSKSSMAQMLLNVRIEINWDMQECLSLNCYRNITHLFSLIFGLKNKIKNRMNKMGKTFKVKLKIKQHLGIWQFWGLIYLLRLHSHSQCVGLTTGFTHHSRHKVNKWESNRNWI